MHADYIPDPLLDPLRRRLTKAQWHNLVVLIVAVQLGRTFIQRQLALFFLCTISTASCYRRLERLLGASGTLSARLGQAWARAVIATFAPGRGRVTLVMDWTWHRDRCRSFWIMLPVGGRAVPVAFWLAPPALSGAGSQRAFEDQALTQLRQWLSWRRRVLLIGDRGFGGRDRIRLLKNLRFQFVLRVNGDTMIEGDEGWQRLSELCPPVGKRRAWAWVLLGKSQPKARLTVNVVAVHQRLLAPKPVLTEKGKPTGQHTDETTWFLVTDLPLETDAVVLYQQRMQVEETLRDFKALLGLEKERTKQPWERLEGLVWALMIGVALDLKLAGVGGERPARPPRISPAATEAAPLPVREYRSESATREGLHELVVQLFLGQSPLTPELRAVYAKSQRMKERPQVRNRRRRTPRTRRRMRTKPVSKIHLHA
jgi:hypothetical protein